MLSHSLSTHTHTLSLSRSLATRFPSHSVHKTHRERHRRYTGPKMPSGSGKWTAKTRSHPHVSLSHSLCLALTYSPNTNTPKIQIQVLVCWRKRAREIHNHTHTLQALKQGKVRGSSRVFGGWGNATFNALDPGERNRSILLIPTYTCSAQPDPHTTHVYHDPPRVRMSSAQINSALAGLDRSLVKAFHKVPHYNTHFDTVPPIFDPENKQYDEVWSTVCINEGEKRERERVGVCDVSLAKELRYCGHPLAHTHTHTHSHFCYTLSFSLTLCLSVCLSVSLSVSHVGFFL